MQRLFVKFTTSRMVCGITVRTTFKGETVALLLPQTEAELLAMLRGAEQTGYQRGLRAGNRGRRRPTERRPLTTPLSEIGLSERLTRILAVHGASQLSGGIRTIGDVLSVGEVLLGFVYQVNQAAIGQISEALSAAGYELTAYGSDER